MDMMFPSSFKLVAPLSLKIAQTRRSKQQVNSSQFAAFLLPRVSSKSSAPTSCILSPSHAFKVLLSNSNSEPGPFCTTTPFWKNPCWLEGFTRLNVGEAGAAEAAMVWKLTHLPESTVEASDSSHSGIIAGGAGWPRLGLVGAEAAKRGWRNDCNALADSISQSGFCFVPREVEDERGGVTGALLEIRRKNLFDLPASITCFDLDFIKILRV